MNIGILAKTNEKGQVVIPKPIRDKLGITPSMHLNLVVRDGVLYMYPVSAVSDMKESENMYAQVLKRTRGGWRNMPASQYDRERDTEELGVSEKNKKAW